ncbi:adenylosuccinate lyase family protein [Aliisedimentitalea scapharcae]|uniref:Adenylosuccinate lyase family protein n=1 Tax=Aliisedimentitalea scapharcae TaxID=1524259 RepID=A0ABZ2XXX1_9RHOB
MAGSVFTSALYGDLFSTAEIGRLFTDSAELRAMLLVEGTLAQVQGALGVIPADSAGAIRRASLEIQLDPGALRKPTGQNGVSVPGLVAAFRAEMQAPEHAQFVHWGATSQDIIDTGLMLRLRQALALMETDLRAFVETLATLAERHADTPMPARTYGQHATPTSFGAVVAGWGQPVMDLLDDLGDLRSSCLLVSLSGAAGTSSALGETAAQQRAELAKGLGLGDPGRSWHTDRNPILRIADWMTRVTLALAKLGEDSTDLVQSGIAELRLGGAGASSTMPQKQNPVAPAVLCAVAAQTVALNGTLQNASVHRHQRDGAAWFTEWMCLPQIVLGAACSARTACDLGTGLEPQTKQMLTTVDGGLGMIHAEALSFALAETMPRPDAQAAVKELCRTAQESQRHLRDLVAAAHPELDVEHLFDPGRQLGQAPTEARAFVARVGQNRNVNT